MGTEMSITTDGDVMIGEDFLVGEEEFKALIEEFDASDWMNHFSERLSRQHFNCYKNCYRLQNIIPISLFNTWKVCGMCKEGEERYTLIS